jgi:hypothetical protein
MRRRRIWCETAPPEQLGAPATVALLRRFEITPIVAVWPATVEAVRPACARYADAGLPVAVWPMLADADGRWVSAGNAAAFTSFVEALCDALAPGEVVLDLEPPIEAMRATLASRVVSAHLLPPGADPAAFRAAREGIARLLGRLHARGIAVSAAIAPPIVFDPLDPLDARAAGPWQERLGTPVDGVAWDHVSPMLYTSIIEGWSRGLLGRDDTRAILAAACAAAAARFPGRGGASLGAVGTGAFGDEPTYRDVAELADDVAIARAAGLDDLALFELGGVLRRPPAEGWLEAFVSTPAAARPPPATLRARAAIGGLRLAGEAFAVMARARRSFTARDTS